MLNNIGLPGFVLLVFLVGGYFYAAIKATGKGILNLKNPHNGRLRKATIGYSWTTLLFGWFPALFRGHWTGAAMIFLISIFTFGIASLIFPFFYNKWYVNHLINDGYKVVSADRSIDEISKSLSKELPLSEPSV